MKKAKKWYFERKPYILCLELCATYWRGTYVWIKQSVRDLDLNMLFRGKLSGGNDSACNGWKQATPKPNSFIAKLTVEGALTASPLSNGNSPLSSHDGIAKYLFSFFSGQLGVNPIAQSSVNFQLLYGGVSTNLPHLLLPFNAEQVKGAIFASASEKAPGPDGLTMLFYQRFWGILKDDILGVFDGFYTGSVNLSTINSSWICPIPKKTELLSARDFRPISLVHRMSNLI